VQRRVVDLQIVHEGWQRNHHSLPGAQQPLQGHLLAAQGGKGTQRLGEQGGVVSRHQSVPR